MKILVYKRTHHGDPGIEGCFGIADCMGSVRDRDYDAVIGVGGLGAQAQAHGLAGEVNWIGLGPHKQHVGKRGPEVTFDHFVFYGSEGPELRYIAPSLASRMYDRNVRSILDGLSAEEQREAEWIVGLSLAAPPSPALNSTSMKTADLRPCKMDGRSIRCQSELTTTRILPKCGI